MPHGIVLLTSPRNNNSCYLLFEQPSSGHFHATPFVSSYLWFPSYDLSAFTKSTHCRFSPKIRRNYAPSSSSSYLHSWCIPHNLLSVTKSPVWRLSSRILQAISHSSDHPKALKIFYCRNGVQYMYCTPLSAVHDDWGPLEACHRDGSLAVLFPLWLERLEALLEVVPSPHKSSSGFTTWVGSGPLSMLQADW